MLQGCPGYHMVVSSIPILYYSPEASNGLPSMAIKCFEGRGDGSVAKSICCASVIAWVLIPRTQLCQAIQ